MKQKTFQKTITTKKGKKVLLRFPKIGDVDGLMEYINDLVREDTFISANTIKSREEEQKYLEERLKKMKSSDGVNILAEHEGAIISNAELTRGDVNRRAGHIALLGIAVSFGYRDEGLGSILMEELLWLAKERLKVKIVYLTVYAINDRAKHLYEKYGFCECGCIPKGIFYRGDYIDHVFMCKEIKV